MAQDATRAKLIATARTLISRDGDKFSVVKLCRETKLTRAKFRRSFPSKAALMNAVLTDMLVDSKKLQQEKPEPPAPAVQDEWVQRQFRVFERAIDSLQAQVETAFGEQSYSIATLEEKLESHLLEDHRPEIRLTDVAPPVVEPPPFVEIASQPQSETMSETAIAMDALSMPPAPFDPATISDADIYLSPPLSPTRKEMQDILENARVLASSAAQSGIKGQEKSDVRLVMFATAAVATLALVAGIILFGNSARATQTPVVAAERAIDKTQTVAIIDATGISDQVPASIRDAAARAGKGDMHAQVELALDFLRGDGVGEDPLSAVRWSQMAAAQGEPTAQYILGTLYANGIKPNPDLAFQWFSSAAARGNVKAMHNLAIAFLSGIGVERNPATAASWFGKAAALGYRDSAFDLAVLYERGEGVAQSPRDALRWYERAASAGDIEAAQRATFLRSNVSQLASR